MKILAISPHYDDSELGCGATLAMLSEQNDVKVVGLSDAGHDLLRHEFEAAAHIGGYKPDFCGNYPRRKFNRYRQKILDDFIYYRDEYNPDVVYVPCEYDCHQDHQVVTQEAKRAFKHCTIYGYELPWNNYKYQNGAFSTFDEKALKVKLSMIGCYKSQLNRPYFAPDFIRSLARVRGVQAGTEYAESFQLIRQVI